MNSQTPKIPIEIQAKINATIEQQKADDKIGMEAATSALPGPLLNIFDPAPDIEVDKYKVRRFVDRDFIFLATLNHPLNRFTAISDGTYDFNPSGEFAWQLCWLMTTPIKNVKEEFKKGVEHVKELAADEIGELKLRAIEQLIIAICKQLGIYVSAHLEFEPKKAEGEKSENPPNPSSPPLPTA